MEKNQPQNINNGQQNTPRGRNPRAGQRRPKLPLPFDNRKEDWGVWAYDHRVGLSITLIVYLVVAIAFVSAKIIVGADKVDQTVYIGLNQLMDLEQELERLKEQNRSLTSQEEFDWSKVQNTTSNENALNENLKTDRGNHAAELNAQAQATAERMRANREAYEKGLQEVGEIGKGGDNGSSDDSKREDRKVAGYVTVRLDINNPVRTERNLQVPAFQCEGGGEVIVEIEVARDGKVVSAKVLSGGDDYMRQVALRAARNSTVNIDSSAPERQRGTITYIFIPQ